MVPIRCIWIFIFKLTGSDNPPGKTCYKKKKKGLGKTSVNDTLIGTAVRLKFWRTVKILHLWIKIIHKSVAFVCSAVNGVFGYRMSHLSYAMSIINNVTNWGWGILKQDTAYSIVIQRGIWTFSTNPRIPASPQDLNKQSVFVTYISKQLQIVIFTLISFLDNSEVYKMLLNEIIISSSKRFCCTCHVIIAIMIATPFS